jgi:hypothetical protein
MAMVEINEMGPGDRSEILIDDTENEEHDGWGPIRPRRSSAPPDLHADTPERDTIPVQCPPPEGTQTEEV